MVGRIILLSIYSLVIGSMLFTVADSVRAEEVQKEETKIVDAKAGITPSSIFYWLDIVFERIGIWAQDNAEQEVHRLLALSKEKLAEVEHLAETDPTAAAEAAERYEKYLEEAVQKAGKAQKKNENVDALLQDISDQTLLHVAAFVDIGAKAAAVEQPYIEETFTVIEEQEKKIIESIQDEQKRADTIENILDFLEEQKDKVPPDVQENIQSTLEKLISNLSAYIVDKGEELLQSLNQKAVEFAREQANKQLDKAKEKIIEEIEEIEL